MESPLKILVFSIDFVFKELIKRIIDQSMLRHRIVSKSLFSEAESIFNKDNFDLIIVDDLIVGTSSYELISFLRLKQKIICPIIYFGAEEYDGKRKALLAGASYFLKKPFDPKGLQEILLKSKV